MGGTCASTANAKPPFHLVVTAIQRHLPKTRLALPQKPVSSVAASNRAATATRRQTTQVVCALLETSVWIASASPLFLLAVTVTQRPLTRTPSVRTASFALAASAKR